MDHRDFRIRRYRGRDAEALSKLYRESVLEIGIEKYSSEQVEVWASYADELEEIRHRLAEGITLVAEISGQPVGFGQINPINHVAFLYTSKDYPRMGIAGVIYKWLEQLAAAEGITKMDTRASRVSRSFFEKMGFRLVRSVIDKRNNVDIECFIMEKDIN